VFGVPDCGKVCSEQHVPGYLQRWEELRQAGVSKILCVAVGDAAAADSWAASLNLDASKVQVGAGRKQEFVAGCNVCLGQHDPV
jgi:peroxiredoxin